MTGLDTPQSWKRKEFDWKYLKGIKEKFWVDAPDCCNNHSNLAEIREKRNKHSDGRLLARIEYDYPEKGNIVLSVFDERLRKPLMAYAREWGKSFGTKPMIFDLKEIEDSYETWAKISDDPVLDELFSTYMEYAKITVPEQFEFVQKAKASGALHDISVIVHEKREVLEYLNLGYGREELANGKAHREAYYKAHEQALLEQYRFIQHASKALGGCSFMALVMSCPVEELLSGRHDPFGNIIQFEKWKDILEPEVTEKDIEKAMKLYEIGGYTYRDRKNAKKAAVDDMAEVRIWSTSPSA